MKSSSVSPARRAAFEILLRVEEGAYASILLSSREDEMQPVDRALCHELVMGVLRRQLWIDRLIEYYAGRSVSDLDAGIRLILRLGIYQLRFLSRIPPSAAVNESVKLAGFARLRSASGLVNAVLRRATREPDIDPANLLADPIEKVAVATSHPIWLIERWTKAFGSEEAEALARANNEQPPITFRVVNSRAKESEVLDQLKHAGATVGRSRIGSPAWRISGGGNSLSELVARGQVYVQDEASQLLSRVLDAQPGQRVLDLCAAPGSKTTQIADNTLDLMIVASDLHEHRLQTVNRTAQLHGLKSIHCVALDGLRQLPLRESSFDRVLVDAPCSGTGTLRRNPEIRWRISPADIQDLSGRQQQLLNNAAKAVTAGGRLVYSTCSVEPEENEDVRQAFLDNNQGFRATEVALDRSLITVSGAARTWPHRDGTDGFFICAFKRKAN